MIFEKLKKAVRKEKTSMEVYPKVLTAEGWYRLYGKKRFVKTVKTSKKAKAS